MVSLLGQRALVTGGSKNLGAAIARELAAAGASVAVNYRTSEADASRVVGSLHRADGAQHASVQGDVTRLDDIQSIADSCSERLGGPIDILVNNAGPYLSTPFVHMEVADFDRVWNANVRAIYLLAKAMVPGMRAVGAGRIINVSASSAFVRNRSIYAVANSSVITLTEQLAVELAPTVLVNAVAPGQIHESLDELRDLAPAWADDVVRKTPLGRLATRRDVARVIVELCGSAFDAVTGVTITVDGGLRLRTNET